MKAGILTFHNSRNYGAVMQAYALVETLKAMGVDAHVLDYRCAQIEKELSENSMTSNVIKRVFYWKKKNEFNAFNKRYLCLSKYIGNDENEVKRAFEEYDTIIAGSDQIWNNKITNNDKTFFLKNIDTRKVAYAASCGDSVDLNSEDIGLIKNFDNVSVRERKLSDSITAENINCSVVCDPTVLAGKDIFEKVSSKRLNKNKYVFVFMIWKSDDLLNNARQFAQANGLELISNKSCIKFLLHSKPEDFVSWIANAEYVFTNSFHGTVFSLLFQKKFISSICKRNDEVNIRIKELLTAVGCKDNILCNEKVNVEEIKVPEYESVNIKLKDLSKTGIDFLKKSIVALN